MRTKRKRSSGKRDSGFPQYVILANKIIKKIRTGAYAPGEKLKGMRELAKEYGVSFQVVISAMQMLVWKEYIIPEPKRGNFVNPQKQGRYYRLGVFVNNYNPCMQATLIATLYKEAVRHGYELIMGSNYEESFSLGKWVSMKKEMDGVLAIGLVDDKCLEPLRKGKLPYVVIGNYDIDEAHPQITVPVEDMVCNNLYPHFLPFAGKTVATIVGIKASRSDRETLNGVRRAILKAGCKLDERLLMFAEYGGMKEIAALLGELHPDVLYLHGFHREYNRYCRNHPNAIKPFLIARPDAVYLASEKIDDVLQPLELDIDVQIAKSAVERLVADIDKRHPQKNGTGAKR